jgi:TonB family protein
MKLLALIPIVGVALALNAETVNDYVYQQPPKKIVKKGKQKATVKMGPINEIVVVEQAPATQEKVEPVEMPNAMKVEKAEKEAFDVVEQMPQFPGGPSALMQFLSQNVKYPVEAHKAGVQGRVIANFVVEKDGSITEAKIVKSVSPELDAEALRVIGSMPNWMPGMQNGEPVRVKYTVPITFKLQGGEKPAVSHVMIGPEHKGKSKPVEVVIDGKVVDAIVMNSLNPSDIESIDVEKAKDDQPKDRIIIKMKQKKE